MQILSGEFSFLITETDDGHRNIVQTKMTIRVEKRERGHKQDSAPKRRGILAFLQSEVLYENRGEQHDFLPFGRYEKIVQRGVFFLVPWLCFRKHRKSAAFSAKYASTISTNPSIFKKQKGEKPCLKLRILLPKFSLHSALT